VRILFFVTYCSIAFLGFLSWRRERARSAPRFVQVALAALLGFGVLSASVVTMNDGLEVAVQLEKCRAPQTTGAAAQIQQQSARETRAARKDSQTDLLNFLVVALVSPLCEEMLYRGALQRVARRAFGSRIAIAITGVVFGLAHMSAFHNAFYQHIGIGLALGAVFELAGGGTVGIVASSLTHVLWNTWLVAKPVL
jgi:membrane protease YdiL (CAAX protease family)